MKTNSILRLFIATIFLLSFAGVFTGALSATVNSIRWVADSNQSTMLLTVSSIGGTAPYSYAWSVKSGTTCPGPISRENLAGTPNTTAYIIYSPNATTSNCTINITVTDASNSVAIASTPNIVVNPSLVMYTLGSGMVDQGVSIDLSSFASAGTPPYTYEWVAAMPSGVSGPSPTVAGVLCSSETATPCNFTTSVGTPPGNYTFELLGTDGAGVTVATNKGTIEVFKDPLISIKAPSSFIDQGQNVTLSSNVTFGAGQRQYLWYSGSSQSCALDAYIPGARGSTLSVLPPTNSPITYYCLRYIDNTLFNAYSAAIPVIINNGTQTGFVAYATPSAAQVDLGVPVTFSGSVVGGGGRALAYQWYNASNANTAVASANSNTLTITPSAAGMYDYYLSVTGGSEVSNSAIVSLTAAPAVTAPRTSAYSNTNGNVTIELHWTGGSAPFTSRIYAVSGLSCGSQVGSTSFNYTMPNGNGYSFFQLVPTGSQSLFCSSLSDTRNGTRTAALEPVPAAVFVNSALQLSVVPNITIISAGQSVVFIGSAQGGTPPYAYSYLTNQSGTTVLGNVITFSAPGSYNVTGNVVDSAGNTAHYSVLIKVNPSAATSTIPSGGGGGAFTGGLPAITTVLTTVATTSTIPPATTTIAAAANATSTATTVATTTIAPANSTSNSLGTGTTAPTPPASTAKPPASSSNSLLWYVLAAIVIILVLLYVALVVLPARKKKNPEEASGTEKESQ